MKGFRINLRIFGLMFMIGLASVSIFRALSNKHEQIPVNLPQTNSDSPLIVSPKYEREMGELPYFGDDH